MLCLYTEKNRYLKPVQVLNHRRFVSCMFAHDDVGVLRML